jgi:hypothetical protein
LEFFNYLLLLRFKYLFELPIVTYSNEINNFFMMLLKKFIGIDSYADFDEVNSYKFIYFMNFNGNLFFYWHLL